MASKPLKVLLRLVGISSDPVGTNDGELWYNSTANRVKTQCGGSVQTLAHLSDVQTGSTLVDGIDSEFTISTSLLAQTAVEIPLEVGIYQFDAFLHWDFNGTSTGFTTEINFTGTATGVNSHWRHSSAGGRLQEYTLGLNTMSGSSSNTTDTFAAFHTGVIDVTVAGNLRLRYQRGHTSGVCDITNTYIKAVKIS